MKHDRQLATLAILLLAFALAACGQSGSGSGSAPADDASATDAARPLPEGAQAFSLFGEPLHPNPAPPEIASQQIEADELWNPEEEDPSGVAIACGVATWHLYNGREAQAEEMYRRILEGSGWAGFGYIAAEAEIARMEAG